MRTNHTKAKLASGETVFGTFVRYPDAALVDFLGYQGWDFLVFDGEHGTLEPAACEHMVRAAELHDVTPLVRIPWNQQHIALRFLDLGVIGLQVPWVHSAEDAANAVRYVKYQPEGVRGLAGVRAADYNQRGSMAEYIIKANRETMVIAQVESEQAVRNIHEIVKTPGADVIFIGPADLSNSFGVPGDLKCSKMQEVFKRIVDAVTGSGKALGIMVGNVGMAREWQERGARYILTTTEAMLGPACKEYLRNVRPTTV